MENGFALTLTPGENSRAEAQPSQPQVEPVHDVTASNNASAQRKKKTSGKRLAGAFGRRSSDCERAGARRPGSRINPNSEVKRAHHQSPAAGARRSRRLAVRMIGSVPAPPSWWTWKRREGRAPCASRDSTSAFGVNAVKNGLALTLSLLPQRRSFARVETNHRMVMVFNAGKVGSLPLNRKARRWRARKWKRKLNFIASIFLPEFAVHGW